MAIITVPPGTVYSSISKKRSFPLSFVYTPYLALVSNEISKLQGCLIECLYLCFGLCSVMVKYC